mgnify:CR=1 FL=1
MAVVSETGTFIEINGIKVWHRVTGEGPEAVIQLHGAGFGHYNTEPCTPVLGDHFKVVDWDLRGYGQSDKPSQHYDMEVWADDTAALMDALGIQRAHIHGTSMGGMIAQTFAGKYPERTISVIINCSAAKLGVMGRLIFKNWIDIAQMDPKGPGSRILAELIAWQGLNRVLLAKPGSDELVDMIQRILTDSNTTEVFCAACQAMNDMDLTPWHPKITSPALVIGGDEDVMTPWNTGPDGVGQQGIYEGIKGAEKYVIKGGGHSNPFDSTEEYNAAILAFLLKHKGK